MRLFISYLIAPLMFLLGSSAVASEAPQCIRGNPAVLSHVENFKKENGPLITAFRSYQADKALKSIRGYCGECAESGESKNQLSLRQLMVELRRPQFIKAECVQAALKRDFNNTGHSCKKTGETSYTKNSFNFGGAQEPCVTEELADYVTYATNQAIRCLSPDDDPISSEVILSKLNNETGFNHTVGYDGGVGIGQMTSIAVKEISGFFDNKKRFVDGRGFYVLSNMGSSQDPACAPFQEILKGDLDTPPPIPGNPNNYCRYLSMDEGLARSLVYSIAFYVFLRDQIIKPNLARRAPHLIKNKSVVAALSLVAYGPDGADEALSLMRRFAGKSTKPEDLLMLIRANNTYARQTQSKMKELETLAGGIECLE